MLNATSMPNDLSNSSLITQPVMKKYPSISNASMPRMKNLSSRNLALPSMSNVPISPEKKLSIPDLVPPSLPTVSKQSSSSILPPNITSVYPPFSTVLLLNYDQNSINHISNLLTVILNIEDTSGNKYGDLFSNRELYERYGFYLHTTVFYLPIIVLKESYIAELVKIIGIPPEYINNYINACYLLQTDDQILQYYTLIFRNKDLFQPNQETFVQALISIINTIVNPPSTENQSTNSNVRTIESVRTDLQYLTSLGLTPNSDNETMKKTLERYKKLTGLDYIAETPKVSPEDVERDLKYLFGLGLKSNSDNETMKTTLKKYRNLTGKNYIPEAPRLSLEDIERDLKYLFGLGLTPESMNETLNERLKQYQELTGSQYVYTASAGRVKKMPKTKKSKRNMRKARNSRR